MTYKSPRDPNTKSACEKTRDVPSSEMSLCQVGSGECKNLAVEALDNGEGGEFLICQEHREEVYAFGKLIAEMTPNQMTKLSDAIASV